MIDVLKKFRIAGSSGLLLFASHSVALACMSPAPMDLRDVLMAELVVSGVIASYEITSNPDRGRLSDYALIGISRMSVLSGEVEEPFLFTWDNSTFGEPDDLLSFERGRGQINYIVTLRRAGSPLPQLRGGSATIPPFPDPDKLTILQAPCAGSFLFPSESPAGRAVALLFADDLDREAKADDRARILRLTGESGGLY